MSSISGKAASPLGSDRAKQIGDSYRARKGSFLKLPKHGNEADGIRSDMENLTRLAIWWHYARHSPTDSLVKRSYDNLIGESVDQFLCIEESGIRIDLFEGPRDQEPYVGADSVDQMIEDIEINQRLVVSPFATLQDDHPLARSIPEAHGWTALVVFRAVHDVLGHARGGHRLTLTGEERAFFEHSQLYSQASRGALAAEVRGPLAWLFFGPHLRRPDGTFAKKGDPDFVPWDRRPYPEQKATLVPPAFWRTGAERNKGSLTARGLATSGSSAKPHHPCSRLEVSVH